MLSSPSRTPHGGHDRPVESRVEVPAVHRPARRGARTRNLKLLSSRGGVLLFLVGGNQLYAFCFSEDSSQEYASPDTAPDRLTALSSFEELQRVSPTRRWNLVLVRAFLIIFGLTASTS